MNSKPSRFLSFSIIKYGFNWNSAIETENVCGGALLLSMSLKLLENIPLREKKKKHACRNKDVFSFVCFVFNDAL